MQEAQAAATAVENVAASKKTNAPSIELGCVVRLGSVSQPPFTDSMFDLITVETHFWWPDFPRDLREIFRVLKSGCAFIIIGELYKGANTAGKLCEKNASRAGMTLLNRDEHREVLARAGFSAVQVTVNADRSMQFHLPYSAPTSASIEA